MHRVELVGTANSFLDLHKYHDYGPMGLQHEGAGHVTGVCSAVSVNEKVIHEAAEAGANVLVVHHGLFWETEPRELDRRMNGRIRALDEHNMTLLAYHLALDAHPLIGNNFLAAKALGVENPVRWQEIGAIGELEWPLMSEKVYERIADIYPHNVHYFGYGPWKIKRIAVVTGGGQNLVHQAIKDKCDLYLTGEAAEPSREIARENKIHMICAGHYQTEKEGVMRLGEYLAAFAGVPHRFILDPEAVV